MQVSRPCGRRLMPVGHIQGNLATWRYIFIIYGSVTILVGVLVTLALPDRPADAWFLTVSRSRPYADFTGSREAACDGAPRNEPARRRDQEVQLPPLPRSHLSTAVLGGHVGFCVPSGCIWALIEQPVCLCTINHQRRNHQFQPPHHRWVWVRCADHNIDGYSASCDCARWANHIFFHRSLRPEYPVSTLDGSLPTRFGRSYHDQQ
jgi:hypothetical protein